VASVEEDDRKSEVKPIFKIGDRVCVRKIHPVGHTRVPRYVRGVCGEVLHITRPFSFPDAAAHGLPARAEPTYHVLFEAADLWSDDGDAGDSVVVDLWETYLETAP
jgi:nitrile hydratase